MDRITKSLLEEFSREIGIERLPEDRRFEHFASFLTVSRSHPDSFDTSELVTGSGGDTGIDAVAILVNGVLVTDPELVEEFAEANGYVDATFIFVQAERSSSFEATKIGQFGFGVADFFADAPRLPRNGEVEKAAETMTAVYARSSKFKRDNPACKLFYVTTGKWVGDQNLEARALAIVQDLEQLAIFRDVEFIPVGADTIQKFYNQTKNAVSREFTFSDRIVVPEMPGVEEAYLGILPAKEFIELLDDGGGGILKSIFYDNVRDWQDYNAVNSGIKITLESGAQRARFALMNNGVTVIAKTVRATGNKMYIEDYQIVNGCQSSHVLFEQRDLVDDSVYVPLRLISTKLEAYFQTFDLPRRLYYERRSRQYNSIAGIEKTRIVTPSNLIRAYASIFLEEPHRTTRTYRLLLAQLGKSIFGPDHQLESYYYAASALYRLEFLFRNGSLDAKYKPARHHILFAARLIEKPERPPRANSYEMVRYCESLLEVVWDVARAEDLFRKAATVVDAAARGNFHRDHIRTEPFTAELRGQVCRADS